MNAEDILNGKVTAPEAVDFLISSLNKSITTMSQECDRLRAENKRLANERGIAIDDLHTAHEVLHELIDLIGGSAEENSRLYAAAMKAKEILPENGDV